MAKRRTELMQKRQARNEARAETRGQKHEASGKSKYALKKKGQRRALPDPNRRPSWFVREGWAALAESIAQKHAQYEGRGRAEAA